MNLMTTLLAAAIPVLLLLGLLALLWSTERVERRRNERYARQIALTDAIHRELGAVAAPTVHRGRRGKWTVSMAVPFDQPAIVAALLRITERMRDPSDGTALSYEVVLTPLDTTATSSRLRRFGEPIRAAA